MAMREHPGMISEREHVRLRNLGHYAHPTKSQPSKMANFDDKSKTDAGLGPSGPGAAGTDSINKNQREGSPIASKPTRGGGVGGSKAIPTASAINQDQTPKFPAGATVKKRGKWKSHRGAKIRPSGPEYGGPNSRP